MIYVYRRYYNTSFQEVEDLHTARYFAMRNADDNTAFPVAFYDPETKAIIVNESLGEDEGVKVAREVISDEIATVTVEAMPDWSIEA